MFVPWSAVDLFTKDVIDNQSLFQEVGHEQKNFYNLIVNTFPIFSIRSAQVTLFDKPQTLPNGAL